MHKMMQILIHNDKLKRAEQNIWNTSTEYNKKSLFPKAIENDIFDKKKYTYKARVKHVRDDD